MTPLQEWLDEMGAKVLGVVETEHEAGMDPRCSICADKLPINAADAEPSCGYHGYALVPAAEVRIYAEDIGEELLGGTGGAITCCRDCCEEAKSLAPKKPDARTRANVIDLFDALKKSLEGGAA